MQVRVQNLYYLLAYARGRFDARDLVDVDAVDATTAEDLFARVLLGAARRLLRQRLDRGYREETDDLRRPRGKIDVGVSVSRALASRGVLRCGFDEVSEDVAHNRVVKATARRLAGVARLDSRLRGELLALVREMSGVADVAVSPRDFRRLQLHSNLGRYRLALNVCELVVRCLLPEEGSGRWRFRSFAGDEREMGLLFEDFVREYLKREQREFPRVERTNIRWRVEGETHGLLPGLETDVTLRRPGHVVVVETKCYGEPLVRSAFGARATLRSKDVCQLAAYLANLPRERDRLTGVLLYAVDRPAVPPTRFDLLGHEVLILELNLDRRWDEIGRALLALVDVFAGGPLDALTAGSP